MDALGSIFEVSCPFSQLLDYSNVTTIKYHKYVVKPLFVIIVVNFFYGNYCYLKYRIMIHMKKILELLLSVSLKVK